MFPTTIPATASKLLRLGKLFFGIILDRYGAATTRSICPFDSGGRLLVATILVSRTNHWCQSQRLREFTVHNHSKVMVACDFFVVITATFRTLYVFVVMEIGSRQ